MADFVTIVLSVVYIITLYYTLFWLTILLEDKPERLRKLSKFPKVSVIIPAYNEEETVIKSVRSVMNLDYPKDYLQIIVVNDGSTDKTKQVLDEYCNRYKDRGIILIHQKNQGKYMALNNALDIADGEFFACLDADSVVKVDALQVMLPHFDDPKTAAVLPLLKVRNPRNLLEKIQWFEYLVNIFYKSLMSRLNCVHVAPGPFSLYKKSYVDSIGRFRKAHNVEDLEIVLRLQRKQYKVKQIMNTAVFTVAPKNLKELYYQRNRWNKGSILNVWDNRDMLFNKRYGDFGLFQMPIVLIAGFISLLLIGMIIWYSILKPLGRRIYELSLVNYDIFTYLTNLKFSFNMLDLNYYKVLVMFTVLIVTVIVLATTQKYTKEKLAKQGLGSLFVFVFFYYIILGVIWAGIAKDLILRKNESRWKTG